MSKQDLNKPIIDKEYISIANLFSFVVSIVKKYLRIFLYIVIIYAVYFFIIKTPIYFSSASFYTNYKDTSSLPSFGLLSSLTKGESDTNDLGFSVETYLSSEIFLNQMVTKKYIIDDSKISLVDYWGNNHSKIISVNPITTLKNINKRFNLRFNLSDEEKRILFAKDILKESLYHLKDDNSPLHIVGITVDDLKLANQISQSIVSSIINYSTSITNIKAKEKAEFIQQRLNQIKTSLENSENEKLLFLEKNNDLSSPSLVLKSDRLNRKILLYEQVYSSLSEELEMAKIDQQNNTSTIFLLDESNISSYKPGKTFLENVLTLCTIFFSALVAFQAYKKRDSLFIK